MGKANVCLFFAIFNYYFCSNGYSYINLVLSAILSRVKGEGFILLFDEFGGVTMSELVLLPSVC